MSIPRKVVLLRDLDAGCPGETIMRFRLLYDGELRPTGGEPTKRIAPHSHAIRRHFHTQLKRLGAGETPAAAHREYGYSWVPLIGGQAYISLDILFLWRAARDGGVITSAGNLDGRIKTIMDALRVPNTPGELVGGDEQPRDDEDPFYCLLENDNQVTGLSVEADTLLEPPTEDEADQRRARVVVTVNMRRQT